ncbi:MAG: pyrroline-5-carboxylate reductase [Bacteroidetes bacterium]|nr:pyrroline-5-carboxylate reductase [Bacteroidota bacterium]
MKTELPEIAILGGGNIGLSLANGLVRSGKYKAADITVTRRSNEHLSEISKLGFSATTDNRAAVTGAGLIVIAVLPQQLNELMKTIAPAVDEKKQVIVSVVSGVTTGDICRQLGKNVQVVRAMPNTAIAIGESMTCISSSGTSAENLQIVKSLFETVGKVIEIHEELMTSATALNACGIAFFLRAIRAASQGGVEIGFHADEALQMAAQTAKGAASLILKNHSHPENEIDKVTSPKGCTIAGLNEMEHEGFSSALIKGIITSSKKAGELYTKEN